MDSLLDAPLKDCVLVTNQLIAHGQVISFLLISCLRVRNRVQAAAAPF